MREPPGLAQSPAVDPWAGAAAGPWANAAPPTQAAQPEQPGWDLDAFGKGKGKGGNGEPRGPLQCYNCLGEGHLQFLCPSDKGAGKSGLSPICGNCKGRGHSADVSTSMGDGKHTPKGKRKSGAPNFFVKGSWGKGIKFGMGKGKGKISDVDDADGRT